MQHLAIHVKRSMSVRCSNVCCHKENYPVNQIYSDQGRGEESQGNTGRKSYWKGYGVKGTINEGEQSYMYTCSVATQQL